VSGTVDEAAAEGPAVERRAEHRVVDVPLDCPRRAGPCERLIDVAYTEVESALVARAALSLRAADAVGRGVIARDTWRARREERLVWAEDARQELLAVSLPGRAAVRLDDELVELLSAPRTHSPRAALVRDALDEAAAAAAAAILRAVDAEAPVEDPDALGAP
jgi:hypothetical protein